MATMRSPATSPARAAGLPGNHLVDQWRAEVHSQSQRGQEIALPVGGREAGKRKHPLRSRSVGAFDLDGDRVGAGGPQQAPAHVLPAFHGCAIDRDDDIAALQSRRGRRRVRDGFPEQRLLAGDPRNVAPGEQQHGERKIGERSGRDDRDPFPDGLPIERARQVGNRDIALALVGHLDVAAQRHGGKGPLRPIGAVAPRPDYAAEANREAQDLDAAQARDPVVAEFVEDDEHAQHDEKSRHLDQYVHPSPPSSPYRARVNARASVSAASASSSVSPACAGNRARASAHAAAMSV